MRFVQKMRLGAIWLIVGAIALSSLVQLWVVEGYGELERTLLSVASDVAWSLIPVVFAVAGGLIIAKKPGNRIGWLLIIPAATLSTDHVIHFILESLSTIPDRPGFLLFVIVWFSQVGWLLIIFPTLFIALIYPTGQILSDRWRWAVRYGLFLLLFFWLLTIFVRDYSPNSSYGLAWSVVNPIGLYTTTTIIPIVTAWLLGAALWTILCAASLIVRFRRAGWVERAQIKWLLYAMTIFAAFYAPNLPFGEPEGTVGNLLSLLIALALLGFPIAITVAILKHRVFDIDLVIRKTVAYAVLSALLAFLYFGTVLLLQNVFESATGQRSPVVIVISTLVIAALFSPLRRRVQAVIDRRFFRSKYDVNRVMNGFAQVVRDELDLASLAVEVSRIVNETVQPEHVRIWLPQSVRQDRHE